MSKKPAPAPEEPNPAYAPVPEVPVERTYTVIGPHRVHECDPGKTFTAVLPLDQEAFLIAVGHIKRYEKE